MWFINLLKSLKDYFKNTIYSVTLYLQTNNDARNKILKAFDFLILLLFELYYQQNLF